MSIINEEKSWLEWLVFGLSTLLIAVVVGYLIYDASQDEGRPPEIQAMVGSPSSAAHGSLVPVMVTNTGDKTAEAVELEVVSGTESAALSFDFLSSGEVRRGWVGFAEPPTSELKVRVVGYRAD